MTKLLTDKVAIVTGGSRGIGRAIALDLAENGAQVVVNYRSNADAAADTVAQIEATGGTAMAVQADVSETAEAQRLVQAAVDAFGRIDILVNNAGTTRDGLLMRMSEADWDAVINTNLKSTFNCCKAVVRPMLKGKRGGRIINVSSVVGLLGAGGQVNYAASKAGIHGLTLSLARELGPRAITVNAVAPGLFITELTEDLSEDAVARYNALAPLGRVGKLPEVAYLVTFLASDKAAYITGEVIRVDGGVGIGS